MDVNKVQIICTKQNRGDDDNGTINWHNSGIAVTWDDAAAVTWDGGDDVDFL